MNQHIDNRNCNTLRTKGSYFGNKYITLYFFSVVRFMLFHQIEMIGMTEMIVRRNSWLQLVLPQELENLIQKS